MRSAALSLALAITGVLRAQTPASLLVGRVTDGATGTGIAGATVVVRGTLLGTATNAQGEYRVRGVPTGPLTVRVAVIGYESQIREGITLAVGDTARADFVLRKAIVELSEVAVTASQSAEKPGDTPASEAVLSKEELVRRNVITIDQALAFVPGVIFNNGDIDIRGSTGIAGGTGSRVLMMIDGHPVLSGDGEAIDFAAIPLLDVDRIEVVKGGYSALYGSSALGGVVNVITTPIPNQPETAIGIHYGSYDLPREFRFADHPLTYSGVELERSQRFGDVGVRAILDRESDAGFRQDNGLNRWLLRTRVDIAPDSPHAGSFYAIYKWEQNGNFLGWLSPQHPFQVPLAQIHDHSVAGRLSLGATAVPVATPTNRVELNPYLDYNADRDDFPSDTVAPNKFHRSTRIGSRVQWTTILSPGHTVILGTDVSGTSVVSDELSNHTLGDAGAYVQDQYAFTGRLSAIGGLRLDWHDVSGAKNETSLSPKLGLVFKPTEAVSTRVSISHGYRAPAVIEQFVNAFEDGFNVTANPALHGETSWSEEIGTTATVTRWLWLDGALFQTDYCGLIGPSVVGAGAVEFQNLQRARIRGLDFATKAALLPRIITAQVNYTYLDARDIRDKSPVLDGTPLPYRSRHNLTGSIDLLRGLAGVDVRYRSRVEQVLIFQGDPRGDITTVDVRLGYRVFGTLLEAKATNVLQARYVDIQERVPGQPRTLYVSALRYF